MRSGSKDSLRALRRNLLAMAGVLVVTGLTATLQAQTYTLDSVLAKMDGVSNPFTSMEASLVRSQYNDFVGGKAQEIDRGKVFMRRKAKETSVRYDTKAPKEQTIVIDKGKFIRIDPKAKEPDIKAIDPKKVDLLDFLLLGFGQSSEEIKKAYIPSLAAAETVGGKKAVVLNLQAKPGSGIEGKIASVRLWMDPDKWVPLQVRITQPNKDWTMCVYTNVKMGDVSDSVFDKLPKK